MSLMMILIIILLVSNALDSPLLNDNRIKGAQNVLLLILSNALDYLKNSREKIIG